MNQPEVRVRPRFDRAASFAALAFLMTGAIAPAGPINTIASFKGVNGGGPIGGVIFDSLGNLYGTTSGLAGGSATVFEVARGSNTVTTLATFVGSNGTAPQGTLIMDSAGNLYGTTSSGGANGYGTVFEVAKGSGAISTLSTFNGTNGAYPGAGLVMDSAGNLYGTTYGTNYGVGAGSFGTVFEIAKATGTLTTLAAFAGANGANPSGSLVVDGAGNIYGTTYAGGANGLGGGEGTIFEIAAGSKALITLASFNGMNGASPWGNLILDPSGNLYGTTYTGGSGGFGTVFELPRGSGTIADLASFSLLSTGSPPLGLTIDPSGNIYGVTGGGTLLGDGSIFEIATGSRTLATLATFNGLDGASPTGLTLDAAGNLYGTAYSGGAGTDGTVFELTPGVVPEPASLIMLGSGLAIACGVALRRKGASIRHVPATPVVP